VDDILVDDIGSKLWLPATPIDLSSQWSAFHPKVNLSDTTLSGAALTGRHQCELQSSAQK
jgi:hypothetical protein